MKLKKKEILYFRKNVRNKRKKSGNEHAKIHYKICSKNKLKRKVRNMKKKTKEKKTLKKKTLTMKKML